MPTARQATTTLALLTLTLGTASLVDAAHLDDFARCLRNRGAIFYGTYWCPQCARQRELFGGSDRLLRYVECAEEGTDEQRPACWKAHITGYPTWEFRDGTRAPGRQPLERLAARTGCTLPD